MGPTHAAIGAAVGLTYSEQAHLPPPQMAYLTIFTTGLAILPDIDHLQATMAHSFGFLTWSFAWVVGKVSRGHRMGTHSLPGMAALTGLAMLAVHFRHDWGGRLGLCFLLALTFAAIFCATGAGRFAIRRCLKWAGLRGHISLKHLMEVVAIGLAVLLAFTGWGLGLLGLATLLGCCAHIGADMLTKERCPLLFPLSRARFGLLPECFSFTTDHWQEHRIVMPLTGLAFSLLVLYAAAPATCLTVLAHIHHAI